MSTPPRLDRLAAPPPKREGQPAASTTESFSDGLTETQDRRHAGRYFVSPRSGHERLTDWCSSDFQRDPRWMSPYALRHLPDYLDGGGPSRRPGPLAPRPVLPSQTHTVQSEATEEEIERTIRVSISS